MYTYYTHLNTLYIKKIPAKFNPCMYTYTLSPEWFDYRMFSPAKEKKRELNIANSNELSFTSFGEYFFSCSTEVPLMRQSMVMYQKGNIQ